MGTLLTIFLTFALCQVLYESSSDDDEEEEEGEGGEEGGPRVKTSGGIVDLEDMGTVVQKMKKASIVPLFLPGLQMYRSGSKIWDIFIRDLER